ncbi:MAG: D-Ala-D-Ala carboxypeptidase family metallohydrolase [Hyphomicrobiales bacterium]|nr:D-Ala-D-Ala carboxypeptidase family metallohydrolase [Hyphomicrobiales bacterium]
MVERTYNRLWRTTLQICFIAGVLMAAAWPDQAHAFDTDPVWAADKADNRTLALVRARATARRTAFLDRYYPPSPHRQEIMPSATMTGSLGDASKIGDITITPTSASWKMDGLKPQLVVLLAQVQLRFGRPLEIISGCRSKAHNTKVHGAKRSQHLHCNAVDFQVTDVSKHTLAAYLKQLPGRGGVGVYCRSSYVHLDIGPKREWHWRCRKRKVVKKRRTRRKQASVKKTSAKPAGMEHASLKKAGIALSTRQRRALKPSGTKRKRQVVKNDR